ncbi:MAG TPA: TIGR03086 family metal-binding protein [Acidimicrobiales bacterium]|jgi:uncharacterized protein (TIGR03086 family)|nr:TIGR03086 family metal-binding protein [Acidimicrobiales bacterium]
METPELFRAAVDVFGQHVHAIVPDQWHLPTPCPEWDVRELVNHVTGEDLWCVPLFAGSTIADVGDRFDGDVLGDDPVATWDAAAADAIAAVAAPGAMDVTTHLSFGDVPGREYTMQLFADHLIHGWDLARAIGADEALPDELVDALATWFADREELYRGAGVIGPKVAAADGASAQDRLLAAFGRTP